MCHDLRGDGGARRGLQSRAGRRDCRVTSLILGRETTRVKACVCWEPFNGQKSAERPYVYWFKCALQTQGNIVNVQYRLHSNIPGIAEAN